MSRETCQHDHVFKFGCIVCIAALTLCMFLTTCRADMLERRVEAMEARP